MAVDEKRELELSLIALAEEMWKLYKKWNPKGAFLEMKVDSMYDPYAIDIFNRESLQDNHQEKELSVDKRLDTGLYIDWVHDGSGGYEVQHFNCEGADVSPFYDERKADKKDG